MAIIVSWREGSMSREQYDSVMGKLDANGYSEPDGRLYHVCYDRGDTHLVTDVWESQEQFEAFGATLGPIMGEAGVTADEPEIYPVARIESQ